MIIEEPDRHSKGDRKSGFDGSAMRHTKIHRYKSVRDREETPCYKLQESVLVDADLEATVRANSQQNLLMKMEKSASIAIHIPSSDEPQMRLLKI